MRHQHVIEHEHDEGDTPHLHSSKVIAAPRSTWGGGVILPERSSSVDEPSRREKPVSASARRPRDIDTAWLVECGFLWRAQSREWVFNGMTERWTLVAVPQRTGICSRCGNSIFDSGGHRT